MALNSFLIFCVIIEDVFHRIYIKEGQVIVDEFYNFFLRNFPNDIKSSLSNLPENLLKDLEEIRMRINTPLCVYANGQDLMVSKEGKIITKFEDGLIITKEHLIKTFQLISNYSIYAITEEIRNGFITIKGGHRVGIGGKVVYKGTMIETIKDISSLNFRIGREKIGISDYLIKSLMVDGIFCNTLIISPPQCGKTTLLRDIIRNLSNGMKYNNIKGFKVGLVDERSEIAGVYNGIPQKDIGIRTDVLDACPKALGIIMMIRSMSPEIIAVDEIGSQEDIYAIEDALRAGIKLIATVHGKSIEDIRNRNRLGKLLEDGVFQRFVILDNSKGVGTIKSIINSKAYDNLTIGGRG